MLTTTQFQILQSAIDQEKENKGIYPTGGPEHRAFQALQRMGLLRFEKWHLNPDGKRLAIYKITGRGKHSISAAPGEQFSARSEAETYERRPSPRPSVVSTLSPDEEALATAIIDTIKRFAGSKKDIRSNERNERTESGTISAVERSGVGTAKASNG